MSNELEKYLRENPDALDRKKPDDAVLGRILKEMASKRNEKAAGIIIPFRLLKWAVACLLIAVCGIAVWYVKMQRPAIHVVRTSAPEKQPPRQVGGDMAARALLFSALYNMQSAASRIDAVASVSRLKNEDNSVVDALEQLLNNDPNSNVRLATLDGLAQLYKNPDVRRKLAASLKKQQDPLVQISLITLLTRMRELSILPDLDKMVQDQNTNKAVKDFAFSGILQLRPELIN
jgi:hypothetical protein